MNVYVPAVVGVLLICSGSRASPPNQQEDASVAMTKKVFHREMNKLQGASPETVIARMGHPTMIDHNYTSKLAWIYHYQNGICCIYFQKRCVLAAYLCDEVERQTGVTDATYFGEP